MEKICVWNPIWWIFVQPKVHLWVSRRSAAAPDRTRPLFQSGGANEREKMGQEEPVLVTVLKSSWSSGALQLLNPWAD